MMHGTIPRHTMRAIAVGEIPPLPFESSRNRAWRWWMAGIFVVVFLVGRVFEVRSGGEVDRVVFIQCKEQVTNEKCQEVR